jgi:unspecific monooxygenase
MSDYPDMPGFDPAMLPLLLPFDPFDPAFHADPYPTYRKIRESGPVVRTPGGVIFANGYREVSDILRDPRFGWGDGEEVSDQFIPDGDGPPVRPLIFLDPPDHTRIRSLVTKAFSARMVERMRPRAEQAIAELISNAREKGDDGDQPVDLMSTIAGPLPALLSGALMGVSPDYLERFSAWAADSGRGLDPPFVLTAEQIRRRDTARASIMDYFHELAARRRVEPADDLVSELVAVEQEGDRLTELELVATCMTLLAAGYATTVNLIGGGLKALLRNPEQLAWFRAHPDQAAGVVEELVRYDSPIQLTSRVALEDMEIAGVEVESEQQVFLMIGAANHDPAVYDRPDELDVTRTSTRNLGFGLGIHFCLGAPLARLGAKVALSALAQLDITVAEEPTYRNSLVLRALDKLPVLIGPGR